MSDSGYSMIFVISEVSSDKVVRVPEKVDKRICLKYPGSLFDV